MKVYFLFENCLVNIGMIILLHGLDSVIRFQPNDPKCNQAPEGNNIVKFSLVAFRIQSIILQSISIYIYIGEFQVYSLKKECIKTTIILG